jgi:Legionella pneumophila major outer membrane protein precursor
MSKITNILATITMTCLTLNCVYAIPKAPCDPVPPKVCCDEPVPGPYGFYYPVDKCLACPRNFYIAGEFLALQVKQEGFDYAVQNNDGAQAANTILPTSPNSTLSGGKIQGFSSDCNDWSFGFGLRFNMGFLTNHDDWNLDLAYTYLHFEQDESSSVKGNGRFLPFWLVPQAFPQVVSNILEPEQEASAQIKIHYNTLDLSLGKPHHISRCFIVNPYFGIRAAWIDECYLSRYGGSFVGDLQASIPEAINGVDMSASNDFWGVGLRAGFASDWKLGKGFYLFGSTAASILYTKFEIDQSVAQGDRSYSVNDDFKHNIPNVEISLGLGWSCLFNCQKNLFTLRVAYEHHHWWNINQLRRFYDATVWSANDKVSRGDLALNGVSVRLAFDF